MTMRTGFVAVLMVAFGLLVMPAGPFAQSSDEVLLKQAVDREKAKGDIKGAIEIYKKLAQSTNPKIAATARAELKRLQPAPAAASDSGERLITNDRTLGGLGAIRFSPDGRYAIGFRLTPSEFDGSGLYLRNVVNATGRSVFSRAPGFFGQFSAFSPDGQRFAAMMPEAIPQSVIAETIRLNQNTDGLSAPGVLVIGWVEAGTAPVVIEIAKMSLNSFQPLTKPLAWSPDGRTIAVAMPVEPLHTYDLQIIEAPSGALRSLGLRVTGAFDLTWSPDGRQLLAHVVASPGKAGELHLIEVTNGTRRTVPLPGTAESRHRILRWHSTGDVSVVHHNPAAAPQVDDTYLVNLATGQSRPTCSGQMLNLAGAGGLQYAKNDLCREITLDSTRQIVWRHATKRLMVLDLGSGREQPLTSGSGSEEWYGMLSPDDRVEVFVSNRDGRWGLYAAEVARAPVAAPKRLSSFDDFPGFNLQAWTRDGFIASLITNESNILRIDVDPATGGRRGDATERLTQDGLINHTPAVSPDGKRIAYWAGQQGRRFGIAVMDSNGANERLVFETPQDYPGLAPTWRSNSEILFTTPAPGSLPATGSPRRLMSLNIATGTATELAMLSELPHIAGRPQLVTTTNEIFHLDTSYRSILAKSLSDGGVRVVATFEGDQEVASFLPSPDGRKIAYALARRYQSGRACFSTSPQPVATVNQITRPCEIVVMTLETGERKVMATTSGQNAAVPALIAWSPDSRFLLFGGGRPQILDTTAETRTPLLPPSQPLNWDRTASWSPDGRFIVLSDRSQRYEWREWKGVR